jgi:hypothetical protein
MKVPVLSVKNSMELTLKIPNLIDKPIENSFSLHPILTNILVELFFSMKPPEIKLETVNLSCNCSMNSILFPESKSIKDYKFYTVQMMKPGLPD